MSDKIKKYSIYVLFFIIFLILLAIALFYIEHNDSKTNMHSIEDSLWYMLVTITSVGYGDIVPVTALGRIIGTFLILLSLLILGVLISSIASNIYTMIEEKKLGFRGTNFVNHIVCIGWNDFSRMVVNEVLAAKKKVAIVTGNKDDVDLIYDQYGHTEVFVLFADLHNIESLSKTNPNESSEVFLSFSDDTESLIYVIHFKKLYPKPSVVVAIQNHKLRDTFMTAGVKYVVARNEISSKLVASYVFEPDVADLNIDLLSSAITDDDFDNQQYIVNKDNPYLNKKYIEAFIDLKQNYNVVLLGMSRVINKNKSLMVNPESNTIIELNDYLIMMVSGKTKGIIEKLFEVCEGKQ